MSEQTDNDTRAEWAAEALQSFADQVYGGDYDRDLTNPDSFEQCLSDFIADLLHLCDRYATDGETGGECFSRIFSRGMGHYSEEFAEENDETPTVTLHSV